MEPNQLQKTYIFERRKFLFTIFNVLVILWSLGQMIIYGIQVNQIPCSELHNLVVGYIISYAFLFLTPVLSIVSCYWCNFAAATMVYSVMMIVLKIIGIIIVFTISWNHIGMCYVTYNLKIIVICSSIAQISILICQIVLLNRRRKIINETKQVQQDALPFNQTNRSMPEKIQKNK